MESFTYLHFFLLRLTLGVDSYGPETNLIELNVNTVNTVRHLNWNSRNIVV